MECCLSVRPNFKWIQAGLHRLSHAVLYGAFYLSDTGIPEYCRLAGSEKSGEISAALHTLALRVQVPSYKVSTQNHNNDS